MKIAITGHKRGIGKEFAKQLTQRGHEIVGISRSDGEKKIKKSTQPYLASESATVLIQIWMTLGIKTSHEHNTHHISQ